MPTLSPADRCTGCGACAAVCPKGAIRLAPDRLGFDAPRVDRARCVECGACSRACPVVTPFARRPLPDTVWGVRAEEEPLRAASSSGGVFGLLARRTLAAGGRVFGAAFDQGLSLAHREAADEASLAPLLKSKYLQSRAWPVYPRVKALLAQGTPVLFCGTPCQAQGLLRALGPLARSERLLCAAVVCHGVPAPGLWQSYRRWRERQRRAAMTGMDFRAEPGGICLRADFADGQSVRYGGWDDPYVRLFLTDVSLRPACSRCPARLEADGADLLLGDFWGAEDCLPALAREGGGLSLAIPRTDRGRRALEAVLPQARWAACPAAPALAANPSAVEPAGEPPEALAFRRSGGRGPFPVRAAGASPLARLRALAGWLREGLG